MKKLIIAQANGAMSAHTVTDEDFDALNNASFAIAFGKLFYVFSDANDDEVIYKAIPVYVMGVPMVVNAEVTPVTFNEVKPGASEETSPEVASKAGKLAGMSLDDMVEAIHGPDDTEFHSMVVSVAASALTQAMPRTPDGPIPFPKGPGGEIPMAISDLFFNHEHPEYDQIRSNQSPKTASENKHTRAALRKDAEEFASSMASAGHIGLDPDMLVNDFFERL